MTAAIPERLEALRHARVGEALWPAFQRPTDWIHRRSETVEYQDKSVIRRRVTVDCEPGSLSPVRLLTTDVRLLPLGVLRKQPLVGFDLVDRAGQGISLYTREQNSRAAAALLAWQADQLLGHADEPLHEELAAIAADDPPAAAERVRAFATASDPTHRELWADENFSTALAQLSQGFLLLVEATSDRRCLYKYSYEEPFTTFTEPPDHTVKALAVRVQRLRVTLGLEPYRTVIAVPGIGDSRSYHVEAVAPSGLEIPRADLVVLVETAAEPETGEGRGSGRIAQLTFRGATRDATALALISLQAPRRGWLTAALASSVLTAVVLSIGALFLSRLASEATGNAALLVGLTGVVAGLLSRAGEHELASRVLTGRRSLLVMSATLSLIATLTLLVGGTPLEVGSVPAVPAWLPWSWTLLSFLAWVSPLVLSLSFLRSRPPPLR